MKKTLFLFAGFLVIGFLFNSCVLPTSETKGDYHWELFRISKTNYESVAEPQTNTFAAIKQYSAQKAERGTYGD